ncbi:DUF429 domain-containing protein [Frigoribacterium sp. 2-23]|uniref:DUF429 domain-containing protein n=1 Tax=Frigoribacterium sp. 2-23 TaxID=3415006 RepID=UPI003C6FB4D1
MPTVPPKLPTAAAPRYLGVDLAWGEGTPTRPANETGLVAIDADGTVLDAGWARGVDDVLAWIVRLATPGSVVAVDAPLLVPNATGMRPSERDVARGYGRWHVAANATSASLGWLAGRTLAARLDEHGFAYDDGLHAHPADARTYFECYPYTTIVGMAELGYDERRPRYKRPDTSLEKEARRPARAAACDELIRRVGTLEHATPPLRPGSHETTRMLLDEPSPLVDRAYKHREDLLDALICAWTASIVAHTPERAQVLGHDTEPDERGRRATLIATARPEQRVGSAPAPLPRAPRTRPAR